MLLFNFCIYSAGLPHESEVKCISLAAGLWLRLDIELRLLYFILYLGLSSLQSCPALAQNAVVFGVSDIQRQILYLKKNPLKLIIIIKI